ncbi:MAG: MMPL family transporter [Pseudomonadota bacterium]
MTNENTMAYLNWLKRYRTVVLLLTVVFVTAGLWFSTGLNLDPSLESRFIKDNPKLKLYREFGKQFGSEPLLLVVWDKGSDVFSAEALKRTMFLAQKIEELEGVESVISLAAFPQKSIPLAKKLLAGRNGKQSVFVVMPEQQTTQPSKGFALVKSVEDLLGNFVRDGERAFVTGPLAMQTKAIEFSRQDLFHALIIVSITALFLFLFLYRSWQAIAAALLVVGVAICGTCGIMALLKVKLSQFALIAIPILAAISLQDAIHLLEHYAKARRHGADTISSLRHMFASAVFPCVWTTLTTAVAFASLLISDIEQIRSIGLLVMVGAPLALASSLVVLPALLIAAPMNAPQRGGRSDKWCAAYAISVFRHAPLWALALIGITLVAGLGLRYVSVDFDFPNIFRKDVPFQKQFAEVDENLAGAASFEIMMQTTNGSDFSPPEKLHLMRNLQTALSLTGLVATTISPIDVGLSAYIIKHGVPKNAAELMKRSAKLINDIREENGPILNGWVTPDLKKARVHVRVRSSQAESYDALMNTLAYLRDGLKKQGVDMSWSGFSLLYKEMEKRMVSEMTASFAIAFLSVLAFLMILFRSVKWGLIAMIPNVLPLIVTVGIMGWFGVGFSLGLIILPAVGIGLVVDDTIHVIWGVRRHMRGGLSAQEAVSHVMSSTGRALVLSTLILSAGFASLATSPFLSNVELAFFMPLLLILALVFDLIGVPAILALLTRHGEETSQPHRDVEAFITSTPPQTPL